jgi:hypothetical protein
MKNNGKKERKGERKWNYVKKGGTEGRTEGRKEGKEGGWTNTRQPSGPSVLHPQTGTRRVLVPPPSF